MMKRDLLFFFAPIFIVMSSISTVIVCVCLAEPHSEKMTGPSGSGMVCIFYYVFHLFVWLFVALLSLGLYYARYRGAQISNDYDKPKLVFSLLVGGVLIIYSMLVAASMVDFLAVVLMSLVVNSVPMFIVIVLGILVTRDKRYRMMNGVQPSEGSTIFRPSLR